MIKSLLYISLAPVLIVALYVYLRDKYEKEPIISLLKALFTGIIITIPIVFIEGQILKLSAYFSGLMIPLFTGFMVAALTEEGFKFLAFLTIFWRSRDFNERFDGIVYAVFISLGFAAVENMIYVYKGGYTVGLVRAVTAVPAHALFATVMGYHLANAKFYPSRRTNELILAFLVPFLWHGLYDFLLMAKKEVFLLIFIPLFIMYWVIGFKRMKELSVTSIFRNDLPSPEDTDSKNNT